MSALCELFQDWEPCSVSCGTVSEGYNEGDFVKVCIDGKQFIARSLVDDNRDEPWQGSVSSPKTWDVRSMSYWLNNIEELQDLLVAPMTSVQFANTVVDAALTEYTTLGFYLPNDDGEGTWERTADTGVASQLPATIGLPQLTDADGTVWTLRPERGVLSARALGVVGDRVTDDTAALNAGGTSTLPLDITALAPYITDKVTFHALKGGFVTDSVFIVDDAFNMGADAVVSLLGADSGDIIGGVGVRLTQPNVTNRADLIQYPVAVTFNGLPRPRVEHLRVSGAWDGVDATGNTGGAKIDTMEIGAINEGLITDGALDFWHADTLHFWPFGFVTLTDTYQLYLDGTTVAARLGDMDGVDIKTLSTFRGKVITEPGSGIGPFGNIGSLQTDGTSANIEFGAGHLSVGTWYSTSGGDDVGLLVTGGELNIAAHDITPFRFSTSTDPFVSVEGGILNMGPGFSRDVLPLAPTYQVSGGEMTLVTPTFENGRNPSTPRTVGFIEQTGGRLTLIKPRFDDAGSGAGQPALTVTGGTWSSIDVDNFVGWSYNIPDELGDSVYSFPAAFDNSTPELSFLNNGDFVPTFSIQRCSYRLIDNYIDFNLLVEFDTNAYTTASDVLDIITNIPHKPIDGTGVTVSLLDRAVFDPDVSISAEIQVDGSVRIRTFVSGGPTNNLKATAFPPSTSGFRIRITGRYKAA